MSKEKIPRSLDIKLFIKYILKYPFKEAYKLVNRPTTWMVLYPIFALLDAWFLGPISFQKKIIWMIFLIPILIWKLYERGEHRFEYRSRNEDHLHEWNRSEIKVEGLFLEVLKCKFCPKIRIKGGNEVE